MIFNFIKMNALGNDYIFINCLENNNLSNEVISRVTAFSDRHFGVGGDGVILIESSLYCDYKMRIFNSDGTEGLMCGNGIRQLAKFIHDILNIDKTLLTIETKTGYIKVDIDISADGFMEAASVNLGLVEFKGSNIPFKSPNDKIECGIPIFHYKDLCFYIGSLGGLHAACFMVQDVDEIDFCKLGEEIENNRRVFPDRVNVEFVNILSSTKAKVRVWERGAGHTLACGTGATFVGAVGIKLGLLSSVQNIEIAFEKGSLFISQCTDQTLVMKGSADFVFYGTIDLA